MMIRNRWPCAGHALLMIGALSGLGAADVAQAKGGVAPNATRYIYPSNANEISMTVSNTNTAIPYLVKTWFSRDAEGKQPAGDFTVEPPVFRLEPALNASLARESKLRIYYAGKTRLPTDRESVYYVHVQAIPPEDKASQDNKLQFSVTSVLKLFYRPANLPGSPLDAPRALRCTQSGGQLVVNNPTPYYVTLVSLSVGNHVVAMPVGMRSVMAPPKGQVTLPLSKAAGAVTFKTINDYGAMTATQTCPAA